MTKQAYAVNGCPREMKALSPSFLRCSKSHTTVRTSPQQRMCWQHQKKTLSQACLFVVWASLAGGPRLHEAMAMQSGPEGHHCVPGGTSSSRSPCLCQRRRTTARSKTALHRARKTATRAQSTRTVGTCVTQVVARHVFAAVSGTETWMLGERSQDTVTGQGAGLPQQRAQEVVDVPVPQIQESAELHSPEGIDDQIVCDVPRLILNSSLLRLREDCREDHSGWVQRKSNRGAARGRFQPIGFRSTPSKRTGWIHKCRGEQ